MRKIYPAFFLLAVLAPYACSSNSDEPKDEVDGSGGTSTETSDGMGGEDNEPDTDSKCLFDCETDGTGGSDGDTVEPDLDAINKGTSDYCTFEGVPTKGDPNGDLTITDFESGENEYDSNGLWGIFWASTDGTGTSNITDANHDWLAASPGRQGSNHALHITGEDFTEWGAGVNTSLAFNRDGRKNCLYDASEFSGVSFWARGEVSSASSNMLFRLQMPAIIPNTSGGSCDPEVNSCWDGHTTAVEIEECWQQYVIPFEELEQAGWGPAVEFDAQFLRSAEWTFPSGVDFDVYIDDVAFFVGEAPTPEAKDCSGIGAGGAGGSSTP